MIKLVKINGVLHYANEPDINRELTRTDADGEADITGYDAGAEVIDIPGIPVYISTDELSDYSAYNLTLPGWYVFASINSGGNAVVTSSTAISGAAGYVAVPGESHVDVAVMFDVAAVSQTISVDWGNGYQQTLIIHATDLAIRNLDYRTTYYMYDAEQFATWSYALTTDTTFAADSFYYVKNADDTYSLAEVTTGDPVPENTYYKHSKVVFEGLARNVSYKLDTPIDCPVEYILPEIEDETHGAWFELRARYMGSHSSTLTVPAGVKVATEHTQAETKGINMVHLDYTAAGGVKIWRFLNTHASIPTT